MEWDCKNKKIELENAVKMMFQELFIFLLFQEETERHYCNICEPKKYFIERKEGMVEFSHASETRLC